MKSKSDNHIFYIYIFSVSCFAVLGALPRHKVRVIEIKKCYFSLCLRLVGITRVHSFSETPKKKLIIIHEQTISCVLARDVGWTEWEKQLRFLFSINNVKQRCIPLIVSRYFDFPIFFEGSHNWHAWKHFAEH